MHTDTHIFNKFSDSVASSRITSEDTMKDQGQRLCSITIMVVTTVEYLLYARYLTFSQFLKHSYFQSSDLGPGHS